MDYRIALKKCGVGLSAATLCLSLMTLPASAGHKHRYYNGQQAFKQVSRDYGRRVRQGARNYYDRYRSRARDFAGKQIVKQGVQRLGGRILGPAVDLAWPRCMGEDC